MMNWVSQKQIVLASGVMTLLLFIAVIFLAEPAIKGNTGKGMVSLQLAFTKEHGQEILAVWGTRGMSEFRRWIAADYAYLLAYSVFLAGLLVRAGARPGTVRLAFLGGALDAIENTMELFFLSLPQKFPAVLFFIHSLLSSMKWLLALWVIGYLAWRFIFNRVKVPGPSLN